MSWRDDLALAEDARKLLLLKLKGSQLFLKSYAFQKRSAAQCLCISVLLQQPSIADVTTASK